MKRLMAGLLTAGALALAPSAAYAQLGFGLNGGLSLPMGDYGEVEGDGAGGATTGFSVFADVELSVPMIPVGVVVTGGLTSHGVDDDFEEALEALLGSDVDVGRFYAVPILAGPRVDFSPIPTLGLFVDGQIGLGMFRAPRIEGGGEEIEFDWSSGFAWSVGAGVDLPVFFGVGVRYVSLGSVDTEGESSTGVTLEGEQDVSWLDVYLSIGI